MAEVDPGRLAQMRRRLTEDDLDRFLREGPTDKPTSEDPDLLDRVFGPQEFRDTKRRPVLGENH